MPRAWRAAKGCSPIGCNRRCATADNSLDCPPALRSRYSFGKPATGTFACASAHAANHRRDGFHGSPSADWSALATWQTRTAGIARVTSRFPSAHLLLLAVIARCTNVLTNAPSAPLLTCSILPCAWRSGVCSPTSARLLRVGLPALKARHRPGP